MGVGNTNAAGNGEDQSRCGKVVGFEKEVEDG